MMQDWAKQDWLVEYNERVAIRVYAGGMRREHAEPLAFKETVEATGIDKALAAQWVKDTACGEWD